MQNVFGESSSARYGFQGPSATLHQALSRRVERNHQTETPMKISANHLRRYKAIAMLLWKYGRSDLVQQMGIPKISQGWFRFLFMLGALKNQVQHL